MSAPAPRRAPFSPARLWRLVALAVLVASALPRATAQDPPTLKESGKLFAPRSDASGRVRIGELAFAPDGSELLAAGDGGVVWGLKAGGETKSVTNAMVYVAAYTKDGKKRLLGHTKNGWTTQDVKTGKFTDGAWAYPFGGTVIGTDLSAYSPDGKTVLSVPVFVPRTEGKPPASNFQLRVYDPATGKELRAFAARHTEPIQSLARSADGKVAVSGSRDTTARAWDFATGKELSVFKEHTTLVYKVAVSPDGKLAASTGSYFPNGAKNGKTGDYAVYVWETKTGKTVVKFEGHEGGVNAMAITPDGKSVVSIGGGKPGADGKVWELATGKEIARFAANGGSAVAIAPDGSRFAVSNSGQEGVVRLWPLP